MSEQLELEELSCRAPAQNFFDALRMHFLDIHSPQPRTSFGFSEELYEYSSDEDSFSLPSPSSGSFSP